MTVERRVIQGGALTRTKRESSWSVEFADNGRRGSTLDIGRGAGRDQPRTVRRGTIRAFRRRAGKRRSLRVWRAGGRCGFGRRLGGRRVGAAGRLRGRLVCLPGRWL